MSDQLTALTTVRRRLLNGEPLRLVVGDRLLDASEVTVTPSTIACLRTAILDDIEADIARLTPPEPDPAAPAAEIERTA